MKKSRGNNLQNIASGSYSSKEEPFQDSSDSSKPSDDSDTDSLNEDLSEDDLSDANFDDGRLVQMIQYQMYQCYRRW